MFKITRGLTWTAANSVDPDVWVYVSHRTINGGYEITWCKRQN